MSAQSKSKGNGETEKQKQRNSNRNIYNFEADYGIAKMTVWRAQIEIKTKQLNEKWAIMMGCCGCDGKNT